MRIFVIDDEAMLLKSHITAIQEAQPEAEIIGFSLGQDALDAVANGTQPDVVFTDIQMPGVNGMELAIRLRTACPKAKVIFVTGYHEYAVDAYRIHAHGYILKPLEVERIQEELALLNQSTTDRSPVNNRLRVQCFGHFEVFWKGVPLIFNRRQTKELLAFLVDREGAMCTAEEVSTALWEEEGDMNLTKNRIRVLVSDLRNTLIRIGQEDVLIRRSGELAVRKELLDCDYYRMLAGDAEAINSFYGQYMDQYSWAEATSGRIYFHYTE